MITLGHGFYLDELAWFVIPVAVSLWLLRRTERKARARDEAESGSESSLPPNGAVD